MQTKIKNITHSVVAIFVSLILAASICFPNSKAFATNSDEKQAEINALAAQVDSLQTQINAEQDKYEKALETREFAIKASAEAQEVYDDALAQIEIVRPSLEKATKDSYSSYFAICLLNQLVDDNPLAPLMFKFDIVNMFSAAEDSAIRKFVELYRTEKDAYTAVKNYEKEAQTALDNSIAAKQNLEQLYVQVQEKLSSANAQLIDIKAYEEIYGKAGPSVIVGEGRFAHPCPDGTITSPFGESRDGYVHKGIDYSAPEGTPIYAADDGTVIDAVYNGDYNGGRGMYLVISHGDGLVTQYMHCSKIYVPIGARIEKGQNIALVGNTGDSTGPHVHFQLDIDGVATDPSDYM